MSVLTLSFLGAPRLEVDGKPLALNRRKGLALLCYLAVTQQAHSRDALATLLWPDADQSRSRASLRSVLWSLNKSPLAQWLAADAETVSLQTAHGDGSEQHAPLVDVIRFQELLSAAQAHQHTARADCERCAALLDEAVSLYEGDFLAGFSLPDAPQFDEWQFFEAESLRQGLATALEDLAGFHRARQAFDSAISLARRRLALDPLHEPAHRTLVQLYVQSGQRSAALRQLEICRQALAKELGVEPSAETDALARRIQSGELQEEGATGRSQQDDKTVLTTSEKRTGVNENFGAATHNLPPEPAPLVGRRQELARLAAFLEDGATRLVTITGPGGIGKTRLALAAARQQVEKATFAGGVTFVSLAPLSEAGAIISAIAEATHFPFQAGERPPREQVFAYLSRKQMLLVLDNFEHLLQAGAQLVGDLLQRAPRVKIVVTSREPLNLYEEQRLPVQGLPIAGGEGTEDHAAMLFLQVARRRTPDFALSSEDSATLQEICRLVQGMPLALELAAAWTDVLSLREIAAEIRHSLDFMATHARDVPARHQSMQAVFESSWQALDEEEQSVYAQLSVFRGGFTQQAAGQVAGASRHILARLVRKSLLHYDHRHQRYEHHELLRQFAAARLGAAATGARERHARTYAAFLARREAELKGPRQQEALAEVEADGENVAAAWRHAVEKGQIALLETALAPLCLFYERRARFIEGEHICEMAVKMLDAAGDNPGATGEGEQGRRTHLLVRLLTWQGRFSILLDRYAQARRLLSDARQRLELPLLAQRDTAATRAFLLLQLSDYSISNEFGGGAEALNEESLALYQSIDDAWGTALALDGLSQKKMNGGEHDEAVRLHEACLALRERLGDRQGIARSYNILGLMMLHIGQLERSEACLQKSLSIFRALGNKAHLSSPWAVLGINLIFAGRFEASLEAFGEAWAIHEELGLEREPFTANVGMTRARINLGLYAEARRQADDDLATYRARNYHWSVEATLFNLARVDLAEGATARALERLRQSATLLQRMQEQLLLPEVLFTLAYVYLAASDTRQAIRVMVEGLRIVIATEPLNAMRFELPAMALLLAQQGDAPRAVEFYAAARQSPYIANSVWFEDIAGKRIAQIAAGLPPDVVRAAEARGQARDLWQTANALLSELESRQSAA